MGGRAFICHVCHVRGRARSVIQRGSGQGHLVSVFFNTRQVLETKHSKERKQCAQKLCTPCYIGYSLKEMNKVPDKQICVITSQ
jgi:hypothetical protein